MTPDEARQLVIDGMNYAAYRETDFSLHDSDKNRLFGSEHYASGRPHRHRRKSSNRGQILRDSSSSPDES
jgi:hypothetical protein